MNKKRIAVLAACSDPLSESRRQNIDKLIRRLVDRGLTVVCSPYLFGCREEDPGRKKAEFLNCCFADPEVEFIFDVSGGDLANTVLRHLDYEVIKESRALFYGFSDLTTVINAVYARTGRPAVNYQVRNLAWMQGTASGEPNHADELNHADKPDHTDELEIENGHYFDRAVLEHAIKAEDLEAEFLRGSSMSGRIVGGNIRCMLKLAGTPYWPDLRGAILLIEARSGGVSQMTTMLEQYLELGAAEQISGILLGTFTQMEREGLRTGIEEIVLKMFPERIPVARTRFVGHGPDARAIVIGKETRFEDSDR